MTVGDIPEGTLQTVRCLPFLPLKTYKAGVNGGGYSPALTDMTVSWKSRTGSPSSCSE